MITSSYMRRLTKDQFGKTFPCNTNLKNHLKAHTEGDYHRYLQSVISVLLIIVVWKTISEHTLKKNHISVIMVI